MQMMQNQQGNPPCVYGSDVTTTAKPRPEPGRSVCEATRAARTNGIHEQSSEPAGAAIVNGEREPSDRKAVLHDGQ